MFGIKKFLSKSGAPEHLPEDLRTGIEAWRKSAAPVLDDAHFHVRYVVLDIASTGPKPESDELLGVAVTGVRGGGIVLPDDAGYVDLSQPGSDDFTSERQLLALLQFIANGPLVTYHVPCVSGFLQRIYHERLGINFQPHWIDLAWLLPSMFEEKGQSLQPLDHWLELFSLGGEIGRRDAMENNLLLARLFQMSLVRAHSKGIDTAARLVDESHASSFLRRMH